MNNFLHEFEYKFKQSYIWLLHQKCPDKGYTNIKIHNYLENDGENHLRVNIYWTQKGKLFIYEPMKQNGVYPLIEQEDCNVET